MHTYRGAGGRVRGGGGVCTHTEWYSEMKETQDMRRGGKEGV